MLDHLVLATGDLDRTASWLEARTGVTPSPGGPHPGMGTHNRLCALGGGSYLEIIGPDPDQSESDRPRSFGIDDLRQPGIVTWCARSDDLPGLMQTAAGLGLEYVGPVAMSRAAPAGSLSWQLALPTFDNPGGVVPFFIDWGSSPHPSASAAPGLELVTWRADHPDPDAIRHVLRRLGEPLEVRAGPDPALVVRLAGPAGAVTLPAAGHG